MIELTKWHRGWLLLSLTLSSVVSFILLPQQEEETRFGCQGATDFEEKSRAIMMNRIQQLESALDLTPKQMSRLRVLFKGMVKEGVFSHQEILENPIKSKIWKKYFDRALTDEQAEQLSDYDAQKTQQQLLVRQKFEADPNSANQVELAASNLQSNLYLSDQQTTGVSELLRSYLEDPESADSPRTWQFFYDSQGEQLNEILTEDQAFFFLDLGAGRLKGELSKAAIWQKSNCMDCHVQLGDAGDE